MFAIHVARRAGVLERVLARAEQVLSTLEMPKDPHPLLRVRARATDSGC